MRLSRRYSYLIGYVLVAVLCYGALRAFEPVRVSGGSMQPALYAGDLALVARAGGVDAGDIALLKPSGRGPVLHRVTRVLPDGSVVTRGDANASMDVLPTSEQQVTGRVVAVVPVGRWLKRWR